MMAAASSSIDTRRVSQVLNREGLVFAAAVERAVDIATIGRERLGDGGKIRVVQSSKSTSWDGRMGE